MQLEGSVALVTGGAVRVGRAIALALAGRGATVAISYHASAEAAREVVATIEAGGGQAAAFPADLARVPEVIQLVESVLARFGRLDLLVNNAAVFPRTPLATVTEAEWDHTLAVNLKGAFFCAQQAARAMQRQGAGKIVNLADISAFRPWANYLPYCISKAGIVALTQGLAKALAPVVQVNAVAPGTVLFPEGYCEEQRAKVRAAIPLGHEGSPEDVARTVLFLLEGPDFITGTTLPVDGGRLIA